MPDSTSELIFLISKGRAAAFALELQQLADEGKRPSIEGATFKNKTINKFRFKGLDLTNVAFEQCSFSECIFEDCLLEGTFFDNSSMLETTFVQCKGEGFALDTCTIGQSSFKALNLKAPEWSDTQFNECEFAHLSFEEPLLERLTLRQGSLKECILDQGELTHVTLREVEHPTQLQLLECTTQSCYVVSKSEDDELPAGFSRKSGRRRTL